MKKQIILIHGGSTFDTYKEYLSFDDRGMEEPLGDFVPIKNLGRLNKQGGKIFIYQSKDDVVVPYAHLEKYKKALPNAVIREFKKRGHFNQSSFPELIKDIKEL